MFAKVVVDIRSINLQETFDYRIPEDLIEYVFIGSRVKVPFSFREVLGYVIEINKDSEYKKNIRSIIEVYSFEKELNEEQITLARELSLELNAPLVSTLGLMMPAFLKEQSRKMLHIENRSLLDPSLALEFKGKKKIYLDNKLLSKMKLIRQEIKKGSLSLGYEFYTYGKTKKIKLYYILNKVAQKSKTREDILDYLTKHPNAAEDDIVRSLATSIRLLRKMASERVIAYKEVSILAEEKTDKKIFGISHFTYDQEQLLAKYFENENKPFLLFASNNMFLAHFYLKVLQENMKDNKTTVFVVPNILYAEELLSFIREHSQGLSLYAYHSKNSYSDNYTVYMSLKYNQCDCLITTAMGVFLPYTNVGTFFVCDEESEDYIYNNFPYYDAREVIKKRTQFLSAKLVLTSLSPAINTYYDVINSKIILLNDHEKLVNSVNLIDMNEELLEENSDIISHKLKTELFLALSQNKISLLIVNQKAFATMIHCRICKEVLKCPSCSIPLVLYEKRGIAKCNYCDYKTEDYHICKCGEKQMISTGFGMEQVEQKVRELFPEARIMSFALSEQKSSEDYNQYLNAIEDAEVDIIIGTYALTKTFHYDNIKVVGLLYADSFLNLNDYRAAEYTYSLIAKLASKDEVVIQTYNPNNYAIKYAISNDYLSFFAEEIELRKLLNYEPFVEINRLIINGASKDSFHFAYYYRKALRHVSGASVLGPSYDNRLRAVKLIIKHNNFETIIKIFNDAIKHFNKPELFINFERYPKGM